MLEFLFTFIIISILILVHELGHFIAAKLNKVKVEEFGFGYPPRVWGKKIGETTYSINTLPFGGFVKLHGEEEKEKTSKSKTSKAFYAKSKLQKTSVILAGVIGNFLLAIFCFSFIYTKTGIPTKQDNITIKEIAVGSPAESAGLSAGDSILSINNTKIYELEDFINLIDENKGQEMSITVLNDMGGTDTVLLVPRLDPPEGEGAIGVAVSQTENVFYPWWQMPFRGAWVGVQEAVLWGANIVWGLVSSVKQIFGGVVPDIAGPIGIFQITSDVSKQGMLPLIRFTGILSINLAIINILPIPALDGGRLAFLLFDRFIKKEKRPQIEHIVNTVGMAFLLTLMLLVTVNDVWRIIGTSKLVENIASFWPF